MGVWEFILLFSLLCRWHCVHKEKDLKFWLYFYFIIHLYHELAEKAMAPHSSTLAWKIPWMEEPGRLQSMGSRRVGHLLSDFTFTFHLNASEKGNGNPLQCSCLENPRDGGAWWAAVYGVTQSRTRLKRLNNNNNIMSWSLKNTVLNHVNINAR